MPQDPRTEVPASARIDVNDAQALHYWAQHCSVSADEIRLAVGEVGTSVLLVQAYLRKQAGLPPEP